MSARAARFAKLLEVARRRVDEAERAAIEARAVLARLEALEAEAASAENAMLAVDERIVTSAELEQASTRRRFLRHATRKARSAVEAQTKVIAAQDAAVVHARTEARKMEIAIESIARTEERRRAVVERRLEDEHAARRRYVR